MLYATNIKYDFLATWFKRAGALGFMVLYIPLPKDLSVNDHPGLIVQL